MAKGTKSVVVSLVDATIPQREGLYWVRLPDGEQLIAWVHGVAPFLKVELSDPCSDAPRRKPTSKEIAVLTWCGEISQPEAK